ncbi:hypothetical protein YN1_3490 [Nanoarchaeota archaeon]
MENKKSIKYSPLSYILSILSYIERLTQILLKRDISYEKNSTLQILSQTNNHSDSENLKKMPSKYYSYNLEDLLKEVKEIPEIKNDKYLNSSIDKYIESAKTNGKLDIIEDVLKEIINMKKEGYATKNVVDFYSSLLPGFVYYEDLNKEKAQDILNKMREIINTLEQLSNNKETFKNNLDKIAYLLSIDKYDHINDDMAGILDALKKIKDSKDSSTILNKFEKLLLSRYELENYSRNLTNFYYHKLKIMDKEAKYDYIPFRDDIDVDKIREDLQKYEKEAIGKVIEKNGGVVYRGIYGRWDIIKILEEFKETGCMPKSPYHNRISLSVFYDVAKNFSNKGDVGLIFTIKAPKDYNIPIRSVNVDADKVRNNYESIAPSYIREGELMPTECIKIEDIKKIELFKHGTSNDNNTYVFEPKNGYFTKEDLEKVIEFIKN